MPGILPMKVIKVGQSSQSRIAQACDRCRSKKIRCDGIRPTCSQCSTVGFECRTSDKLSRRAFPRGYTESLEERVRVLEQENRELQDLVEEKEEKIEMLSKMHGNIRRQQSDAVSSTATTRAATPPLDARSCTAGATPPPREDTFRVQASPLLLGVENSDSYFMGGASGRAFIESFKRKLQENGKPCSEFNTEAFLHIQGCSPLVARQPQPSTAEATTTRMVVPPRLSMDRYVNIFFQEWSPLFPVLHKPTFLRIYEDFVADPDKVRNPHKLAQLYLVFAIAGLSSQGNQQDLEQVAICEQQWQRSLDSILMDNTIITLQCLVLALVYCTVRADYKRLQHYKGIAVALSLRLGLHQSQKRFSFGALTIETRKKVFWTLYTLDCFSAAILGLPKLLREDDIQAEYPADTDDEYVTEKGFQPTLPGEATKLSSALALFRATRILARVLERIYPAASSHELSLQQMAALGEELDEWSESLPQHLKLTFKQDKPSTDVTGSRSPLLALAYYYIRTLIFRPAVGSSLGQKAASAVITVSECSKHMIQIVQLLEERNLSFSFCVNKPDLLILCGMQLLYQGVDLKGDSKLMKDSERLVNAVVKIVEGAKSPGSHDFRRVASLLVTVDEQPQQHAASLPTPPRGSPDTVMAAPVHHHQQQRVSPPAPSAAAPHSRKMSHPTTNRQSVSSANRNEAELRQQQEKMARRRMHSFDNGSVTTQASSTASSIPVSARNQRLSLSMASSNQGQVMSTMSPHLQTPVPSSTTSVTQNLDFLSLRTESSPPSSPVQTRSNPHHSGALYAAVARQSPHHRSASHARQQQQPQQQPEPGLSPEKWEEYLGSIDGGQLNVYDAMYGGPGVSAFAADTPVSTATSGISGGNNGWSPTEEDAWDLSTFNTGDLYTSSTSGPGATRSVLSLSDDSLSSPEEIDHHHLGGMGGPAGVLDYGSHPLIPTSLAGSGGGFGADGFLLDDLVNPYAIRT